MKYFAVIDTNVLVSAMLNWESNPGRVMELTFAGVIVPLINDDIVAEYRQVLSRPKFCLTEGIIEAAVSEVEKQGILVYIDDYEMVLQDPNDVVFYKIVIEGRVVIIAGPPRSGKTTLKVLYAAVIKRLDEP